ncbi:MAG: hypothetical protein JNK15_03010 [Planctomycetes bacterium]|nr:hypothetical protein [Planctomycetota bacterium]
MSGMRMAKASRQDLDAAWSINRAFDSLGYGFEPMEVDDAEKDAAAADVPILATAQRLVEQAFDINDHDACRRVIDHLQACAKRGSLMRVIMGMEVLLDARNEIVDPSLDYLELHPKLAAATSEAAQQRARAEAAEAKIAALRTALLSDLDAATSEAAQQRTRAEVAEAELSELRKAQGGAP